jgi:hypothetical protein
MFIKDVFLDRSTIEEIHNIYILEKCGCITKFSVKQFLLYSIVVEVAYNYVDHTREDGTSAHGSNGTYSERRKFVHQPQMSK